MRSCRNPSNPGDDEGDRDGQDAWSSAFPLESNHPFDKHPFGRMDRPATPLPVSSQPVVMNTNVSLSGAYESFANPSVRGEHAVLGRVPAPPWSGASRRDDYATSPMRRGELNQLGENNTPSKPEGLYRDVHPGEITPYVGLRARLTQVPINRWTVLLMLVLARLIILFESLNTNLASAQDEAASACSKVEEIGSAMASMPYYMSAGGKYPMSSFDLQL